VGGGRWARGGAELNTNGDGKVSVAQLLRLAREADDKAVRTASVT
jgi:hypothetical protein